jgi:hypothetical protein
MATPSITPLIEDDVPSFLASPADVRQEAVASTDAPAGVALRTAQPGPGVYPNTPMDVYHRWPGASNSRLSKLRQSPAHLKAYLDEPPAERHALIVGRAVHTTILEPDAFDAVFTVAEQCTADKKSDGKRCTNSGVGLHARLGWLCGVHQKGVSNEWAPMKFVLPMDDFTACCRVRDAVYAHPAAAAMLSGPHFTELSVLWTDPAVGIGCKARLDLLSREIGGGTIVDVKSTRDASRREFERAIFTYGYHRQAAFYQDAAAAHGIAVAHYVIIAVEKEPPYAVAVYRLTEGAINAGRDQLRPLLARYAECVTRNQWPGYPTEVQDIAIPPWAWQQIDEEVARG